MTGFSLGWDKVTAEDGDICKGCKSLIFGEKMMIYLQTSTTDIHYFDYQLCLECFFEPEDDEDAEKE